VDDAFDENADGLSLGTDYKTKTIKIDSKTFKINVWDTAGAESKNVTSLAFRKADGIMICCDLGSQASFKKIHEWISTVDYYAKEKQTIKMVIGTKSDLTTKREVDHHALKDIANDQKVQYYETSAKTKENVDEAFNSLLNTIIMSKPSITEPKKPPKSPGCVFI